MARKKKNKFEEFVIKNKRKKEPTLEEFLNIIDREIYLCDTNLELGLLASAMMASIENIVVSIAGAEKYKMFLEIALAECKMRYKNDKKDTNRNI